MGEYDKLHLDKSSATYKRRLATKIILLVLVVGALCFAAIKLYPYAALLKTKDGREYLKEVIEENELRGALLFTGLQCAQIILGVVPPLQILGGMLFGAFWGSVYSTVGIYLGSVVVFLLVKMIGYPIVQIFFDERKISKYKFLQDEQKVVSGFALLYLLPGFPKDILTYLLPLTKIKKRDFFYVIIPARIPAIVISGIVGASIRDENYVLAIVSSVIVIAITAIGLIFRSKIMAKFQQRIEKNKSN